MDGKQYDYKKAYDKNLKPSARLHYLENARHDQDTPAKMGHSPLKGHCTGSPAKQVGAVDPLAQQQMVQPMTNVPPAGSSLVNPFSPQAQAAAQGVFGTTPMMQNAVGAPAMYKDGSPLEGNAFIGAKMAAEKAGKETFEVGGKTFQVK